MNFIIQVLGRMFRRSPAPRARRLKIRTGGNSVVKIGDQTYTGSTVCIVGDKVVVDGVEQQGCLKEPVNVTVNGHVRCVETAAGNVIVHGTVGAVESSSGDVRCGNVQGDVETVSGKVLCRSIAGSVKTVSGNISRAM